MKKLFSIIFTILLIPSLSWAAVDLDTLHTWSTTFDCAEWIQWGGALTCDGLETYGDWVACPGRIATGGSQTTLIDTAVNFVTAGIVVGDSVFNRTLDENAEITSITTTTNANDTLNFAAMTGTNANEQSYLIYQAGISNPPVFYDHSLSKKEQITTVANYSGGGGGKGQIHWLGGGNANSSSGGVSISFTTPQFELWMRYYIKYLPGLTWYLYVYQKQIYLNYTDPNAFVPVDLYGEDQIGPSPLVSGVGWGWASKFSDNQWHCVEWHTKLHTFAGEPGNYRSADGIFQVWVDGELAIDFNDIYFQGLPSQGWDHIGWGSNVSLPSMFMPVAVYYDDITINNIGFGSHPTLGTGAAPKLGTGAGMKLQ